MSDYECSYMLLYFVNDKTSLGKPTGTGARSPFAVQLAVLLGAHGQTRPSRKIRPRFRHSRHTLSSTSSVLKTSLCTVQQREQVFGVSLQGTIASQRLTCMNTWWHDVKTRKQTCDIPFIN